MTYSSLRQSVLHFRPSAAFFVSIHGVLPLKCKFHSGPVIVLKLRLFLSHRNRFNGVLFMQNMGKRRLNTPKVYFRILSPLPKLLKCKCGLLFYNCC